MPSSVCSPINFFFSPFVALRGERRAADEVAPELYERREARFERRRIAIEFVTVERQARFEPQRVARAEPDRLGIGGSAHFENRLEQFARAVVIDEQLEAVFAGVAGARRQARDARDLAAAIPKRGRSAIGKSASVASIATATGPCTAISAVASLTSSNFARPPLSSTSHSRSASMFDALTQSM